MSEHESQLKRIQEKVQLLMKEQASFQKENERLEKELKKHKDQSAQHMHLIDTLRQQGEVLKLNSGEMSELDKKEIEKRINLYIREIDRCIVLLKG